MSWRLRVDWPLCEGRGLCHELAPDSITLDEWGYPVITAVVEEKHLGDLKEAVRGCPQLALRLIKEKPTSRRRGSN
ncbi:MAG: ferredoxin [Nocardioides sp.]|jgi:ferredoxin